LANQYAGSSDQIIHEALSQPLNDGQGLTVDQVKALYAKAFVPINLNIGTKEEFMMIPGVSACMSAESAEYRPGKRRRSPGMSASRRPTG
jgi:hypothetical protein